MVAVGDDQARFVERWSVFPGEAVLKPLESDAARHRNAAVGTIALVGNLMTCVGRDGPWEWAVITFCLLQDKDFWTRRRQVLGEKVVAAAHRVHIPRRDPHRATIGHRESQCPRLCWCGWAVYVSIRVEPAGLGGLLDPR